ncbi:hypothetical protein AGMMS49950_05830 [Endomicrobiia bacterium]|nr:hypothetical protein AGMMS49950_05830 [Endomicrobiia bacterium]
MALKTVDVEITVIVQLQRAGAVRFPYNADYQMDHRGRGQKDCNLSLVFRDVSQALVATSVLTLRKEYRFSFSLLCL